MRASLGSFCARSFGFVPSSKPLLLRSVVRTRFQFVVLTAVQ